MNDELNGTFGRRIMMNGKSQIGWFQGDGRFLHGYGRIQETNSKTQSGLYEDGRLKTKGEIK